MMKLKKVLLPCLIFLLLVMGYAGWELSTEAAGIYDGTIRLHILAASDSERDQALKRSVRDALVDEVAQLTQGASDQSEGVAILRAHIPELTQIAQIALQEAGGTDSVVITLTTEYYPTRAYENLRLPAGEYTSLQVKIGAAQGKNWWCVLFPPVCTSSARAEEAMAETGFSKSQIRLLTEEEDPHYTIRFRVVEQFAKVKRSLKELFR